MPRARTRVRAEALEELEDVARGLRLVIPLEERLGHVGVAADYRVPSFYVHEWEKKLRAAIAALRDPRAKGD